MPKLSVETFLAALTVASLSAACSKAAPASSAAPEPATSATAAAVAVPPAAAPSAAADEQPEAIGPIDAGLEKRKAGTAAAPRAKPSANAACGAGTCSDDMKK